jgi:hypothetical protein
VIYVRRSVWNGQELEPKTENAMREIDIDPAMAALRATTSDRVAGCSKPGMARRYRPATSAIGCCTRFWRNSGSRKPDCVAASTAASPN